MIYYNANVIIIMFHIPSTRLSYYVSFVALVIPRDFGELKENFLLNYSTSQQGISKIRFP